MIEDPLYLPKDTPVFMIGDLTNMKAYELSMICQKEWEKFGYKVTHVPNMRRKQYDFFEQIQHIYDGMNSGLNRLQLLSHIALWKKMRKRNKPCIIVDYQTFLIKDIKRSVLDLPFKYTNVDLRQPNGLPISTSYFIQPRTCHILYNSVMNYNGQFSSVGAFIGRMALENKWVSNEEEKNTIKYVL